MALGAWYGRALLGALGACAALVPALSMWGFTVDDALIPLRYAHHMAMGVGYRFSAQSPVSDGVTPLPWAPLLSLFARNDDLVVLLARVKVLGVLAWAVSGAALGHGLAKRAAGDRRAALLAVVALVVLALAFPVGAWAASGMETGVATALATFAALSFARPRTAALLGGLAACLRPELVVWAVVLAAGAATDAEPKASSARRFRHSAVVTMIAATPFALCTVVRLLVFGRAAPLAVLAKPSDFQHGISYAGAALLVTLMPVLAFAPLAIRRASRLAKTLALALVAHVLVVIAVGGDWMPYARLMIPVVPSLALVFVDVGRVAHGVSTVARTVTAVLLGITIAAKAAPAGRHVYEDRNALIVRARPLLANARVVAALDVGWVGASTNAEIVDLAGLTDLTIAVLPGGHTSKSVDLAMLLDRNVDTLVLYSRPRAVESRLARSPLFREKFERIDNVELHAGTYYEIYRRRGP